MKHSLFFKQTHILIFQLLLAITVIALSYWQATAQMTPRAGDLDATFGTGGKVAVSMLPDATGNSGLRAFIAPDGKIYHFGSTSNSPGVSLAGIVRLTESGALDPTWDADGILVTNFTELSFSRFSNGAVQPDGKVLAGGSASLGNLNYCLLARFLPSGQLDTSFNNVGYALFRNPGALQINFYWWDIAVRADGKIVVGGAIDYQMAAARYNSDGTLDTTFGTNGYRIVQTSILGELWGMKIQPDGKIVMVGKAETDFVNRNLTDYLIARLTADGNLDTGFAGGTGVRQFDLTLGIESDTEVLYGVQILPDGKILAVGRTGDVATNPIDAMLMRFTSDGQFDATFGTHGIGYRTIDYNGEGNLPQDLAVQADGKILIASFNGQGSDFLVQRLLANGDFDTSFGTNGSVETDLGGNDYPLSVNLTKDKILLSGYCGRTTGMIQKLCTVRYLQNGQPANTASLRGRAVNLLGRGISNAQITIRNAATNETQTVTADRSGTFQLPNLPLAQEYIVTPQANRCHFQNAPLMLNFNNPDTNILLRANCFYPIK